MLFQPYRRNCGFLWAVPIPKWQIALLIVLFFLGVWAGMLAVLTHFSKTHTWLLPVFAVGLGAPRWCQVSSATILYSFGKLLRRNWADALGYIFSCLIYPLGRYGRPL